MKKRIPIVVWQKIQPLIDKYKHLVIPVPSAKYAFYLEDADRESDFYFKCDFQDQNGRFVVSRKPATSSDVSVSHMSMTLDELTNAMTNWLAILDSYANTPTFYDDPIQRSYQEEFVNYFSMESEQADEMPFDLPRQLLIDQYLQWVVGHLESQKETATEEQVEQLDSIIDECESLKDEQTVLTQNQTVGRIAKIWAMARKYGMPLIKELLSELKKGGMKALVEKGLNIDSSDIETVMTLIV